MLNVVLSFAALRWKSNTNTLILNPGIVIYINLIFLCVTWENIIFLLILLRFIHYSGVKKALFSFH